MLYASVGPDLTSYDVDPEQGALAPGRSVTLPGNVQEAWPHPSKRFLYVAWSNGGPAGGSSFGGAPAPAGDKHGITAFRIDNGSLDHHGESVAIPSRPIHITVDVPGEHIVTAYNFPSGLTVHRIQEDGTVGGEVPQSAGLDWGTYAHQVRVTPDNQFVLLPSRGNAPSATRAEEDPGALKVFGFKDGVLTNQASIAPNGGYGFQCRHLDFHPTRPWFFLSLEEQNLLQVYAVPPKEALFTKDTLRKGNPPRHALGTVHVHPNGNVVYVANRCSATVEVDGKPAAAGGENSIAVFRINQDSGEPTRIQNIDTQGISPRTFSVDPSGRVLVVGNQTALNDVPASLTLYRIAGDGTLEFARKYDIETGPGRNLFWSGIV